MAASQPLSQYEMDYVNERWNFDTAAGIITRKSDGRVLGTDRGGYVSIQVVTRFVMRSNLIWWKHYGKWPEKEVDHDNRVKHDDRIENLIPKTRRQNSWNRSICDRDLPTGVHKADRMVSKPYYAVIQIDGTQKNLGYFPTIEEASKAYQDAIPEQDRGI